MNRATTLLGAFKEMPDISCPTCGREIYCGDVSKLCSIRPCGILERRTKEKSEKKDVDRKD